jgi:hypothetical protein
MTTPLNILPGMNSVWCPSAKGGPVCRVICIANEGSMEEDFPVTVVYSDLEDFLTRSQPLRDWVKNMIEIV